MMDFIAVSFVFSFSIWKWRTSAVHVAEEVVIMKIAVVFISDFNVLFCFAFFFYQGGIYILFVK